VAIDSTGSIYVVGQSSNACCDVQKFDPSATSVEQFAPDQLPYLESGFEPSASASRFVAIDPSNDHVLVAKKASTSTFKILEFTRSGSFIESSPAGEAGYATSPTGNAGGLQGLAVGTGDRAYYVTFGAPAPGNTPIRILSTPPAAKATIESPAGVTQTKATFTGVAQPSAPGIEGGFATVAWFEYSTDGVSWTATDQLDIGTGTGAGAGNPNSCPTGNPPSCNLSQVVGGLKAGTTYLVRLAVSNGTKVTSATANFTTPDSAPGISGLAATEATQSTATLNGEIEPNGKVTSYHFEWGPTTAYGTRVPADFEAIAGGGSQPIPVSIQLAGLQPASTYHYRIVAKSISGTTTSADQELMTLNSWGLPRNRGIEIVSPANKQPVGDVRALFNGQIHFQAAEEGSAMAFPILNGVEGSGSGGESVFSATRSGSGWASMEVSPPSVIPNQIPSSGGAEPGKVRAFSSNLDCAVVETFNPLTPDTPQVDVENGVYNLYLWSASDGTYRLITSRPPLDPTAISLTGVYYQVAGVTPDCSRAFFRSPIYGFIPGASGFYEWDEGTLRDAGSRPDGSVSPGGVNPRVAQDPYTVSEGGRAFFSATSNQVGDSGKQAVFVRKGPGDVVNASKPTSAVPSQGATYEAASPDGSHVFFLANYGIAATSSNGPTNESCVLSDTTAVATSQACDLYDYNVKTGTLTDISANTDPSNPRGAVVQGVLDVSADGETVYFAARGQLVSGAGRTYGQNLVGGDSGHASVYRYRDGDISYVGAVSMGDALAVREQSGGLATRADGAWASQTTKSGDYLFFNSSADMTGTNPLGLRQAYLYSAETGVTECVSCPKGRVAAERGEITTKTHNIESPGGSGNRYPRSLSEDGTVFFMSRDRLASGAALGTTETTNVYEWDRGQLSLLASGRVTLIDSDDDGRDVYVKSYEQLVPQDVDFAADVYDLRLDSPGFAPAPPEVSCDPAADQCQGTPDTPPSAPSPPSSDFNGPGNPASGKPKPPKCGKGKVLKHGKCVKKQSKQKKKHKGKAHGNKRAASTNRGGVK
jgi:hypothetical protein